MSSQEKYCFEFLMHELIWAGIIQSVDFKSETAIVDITSDGISCWKKVSSESPKSIEVPVFNLVRHTVCVSRHSYDELMKIIEERYSE